jgi:hypothetical protein
MPRIYKTALGKTIDIESLKLQNETVIAVGNQRVNARGDEIDTTGKVVRTKDEQMAEHYRAKGFNIPRDEPVYQNKAHVRENSVTEDYIDRDKLQDVIANLTKQLAEKDAALSKQILPESDTDLPVIEQVQTIEPKNNAGKKLRGGLANAIQKDLEYKDKNSGTSTTGKRI